MGAYEAIQRKWTLAQHIETKFFRIHAMGENKKLRDGFYGFSRETEDRKPRRVRDAIPCFMNF